MENDIEKIRDVFTVPCTQPERVCDFRIGCPERPAHNVFGCEVRCRKWRQNRMKDKIFHHCDTEFKFPGES